MRPLSSSTDRASSVFKSRYLYDLKAKLWLYAPTPVKYLRKADSKFYIVTSRNRPWLLRSEGLQHAPNRKNKYCHRHQRVLNHRPKMHARYFDFTVQILEKEAIHTERGAHSAVEYLALPIDGKFLSILKQSTVFSFSTFSR